MKNIIRAMMLLLSVTETLAQNVTFFSPEFEEGVKRHLNVEQGTPVIQQQTDTITEIDLSGLGIIDIRDVVYLPNVKNIDLSFNDISDVAPLLPLDSLQNVDLRGNQLENISELIFASSDSLVVNIAYNYIKDFSRFYLPSKCHISIIGMAAQKDRNAQYMDVYMFYADVMNGSSVVNFRGYSNVTSGIFVDCAGTHSNAVLDGNFNTVRIAESLDGTASAILSNGEVGDTTYVVPPTVHIVNGGDEVTIDTELPENYRIGYMRALHGTIETDGTTLHYTAPAPIVADTLYMSYHEGNRIRGFTQMYFMSQDFYDNIKTTQQDIPLNMSLHDGVLRITIPSIQKNGATVVKVFDAMGRTLAVKSQETGQEIDITLPKSLSVVIVEVTYAGHQFVTKVASN
ncbi:MAG: hypothetical protein IJJ73_09105 [Bacteroidaceae bacterium]|nr:hypothetical protein [Bacteroidaceae bacterium]